MKPILNSMETAKNELLKYKDFKFHDELIFDEGIAFDVVILRLLGFKDIKELEKDKKAKNIYDLKKTGTFKRLFLEIDKYSKLWDDNIDIPSNLRKIKKIISFSNHTKIIEKLIKMLPK